MQRLCGDTVTGDPGRSPPSSRVGLWSDALPEGVCHANVAHVVRNEGE